jgi:hypothetical protein
MPILTSQYREDMVMIEFVNTKYSIFIEYVMAIWQEFKKLPPNLTGVLKIAPKRSEILANTY